MKSVGKNLELILFDKYLIRTDEYNYLFSTVKDGKEPIVNKIIGKNNSILGDFSNFDAPIFPSSFSRCLTLIREREIIDSNIRTIDELVELLHKIDDKIDYIKRKFN